MDYRFHEEQVDRAFSWRLFFMLCSIVIIMTASDVLASGVADPVGAVLCNVVRILRGRVAQALAIIAIFVLGVQTLRGQLKWEIAVVILTGIIVLFKAPDIVNMVSPNAAGTEKCGIEVISVS